MVLAVELGRVQTGGEGEGKKGEEDLPQGAGDPRQGALQQDEELFLLKPLSSCHLGVI